MLLEILGLVGLLALGVALLAIVVGFAVLVWQAVLEGNMK